MGEVVETFAEQSGTAVTTDFAPSGLSPDLYVLAAVLSLAAAVFGAMRALREVV